MKASWQRKETIGTYVPPLQPDIHVPKTLGLKIFKAEELRLWYFHISPKMQPGVQRCLRKAQNIWLFFFQCAKNCFVLNKGKRYIRLKIPSHHSQKADVGGTSQLPCPACFSRGQTSHLRVLRKRSGGSSSRLDCRAGSLAQRAGERGRAWNPLATPRHVHPLHYWVRGRGKEQHRHHTPHFRAYVVRQCVQHALSNPLLWPPFVCQGNASFASHIQLWH